MSSSTSTGFKGWWVISIIFLFVAIGLAILTYFSFEKDSNAEKIGFMAGSGASLFIALVLLFVHFRTPDPVSSQNQLPTEDTDILKEKKESSLITLGKTLKKIGILMNSYSVEPKDNYYKDVMEKFEEDPRKITNQQKKKLAIDFYRTIEYFDYNKNFTDKGKTLANSYTGEADCKQNTLSLKDNEIGEKLANLIGSGFENITGGTASDIKIAEFPKDVYCAERIKQGKLHPTKEELNSSVNKINQTGGLFGEKSLLGYYIDNKKLIKLNF